MGISLLSCYHGAQIFEIYGLGKEVVDAAFFGSVSRVGGLTMADVQREAESFWVKVCSDSSHQPSWKTASPTVAKTSSIHCQGRVLHELPADSGA